MYTTRCLLKPMKFKIIIAPSPEPSQHNESQHYGEWLCKDSESFEKEIRAELKTKVYKIGSYYTHTYFCY